MGGEVWTILRDKGNFDDYTAQFVNINFQTFINFRRLKYILTDNWVCFTSI